MAPPTTGGGAPPPPDIPSPHGDLPRAHRHMQPRLSTQNCETQMKQRDRQLSAAATNEKTAGNSLRRSPAKSVAQPDVGLANHGSPASFPPTRGTHGTGQSRRGSAAAGEMGAGNDFSRPLATPLPQPQPTLTAAQGPPQSGSENPATNPIFVPCTNAKANPSHHTYAPCKAAAVFSSLPGDSNPADRPVATTHAPAPHQLATSSNTRVYERDPQLVHRLLAAASGGSLLPDPLPTLASSALTSATLLVPPPAADQLAPALKQPVKLAESTRESNSGPRDEHAKIMQSVLPPRDFHPTPPLPHANSSCLHHDVPILGDPQPAHSHQVPMTSSRTMHAKSTHHPTSGHATHMLPLFHQPSLAPHVPNFHQPSHGPHVPNSHRPAHGPHVPSESLLNQALKQDLQPPRQLPEAQAHDPSKLSGHPKAPYASTWTPATILNPTAPARPNKSFLDAVTGSPTPAVSAKPVQLYRGEPAVMFSKEEVQAMAEPYKLALVGKFSFGRPPMDTIRKFFISMGLKGNSQISLLDNRHVLIKLSTEEDYSRIWVRQTWYVDGRGMRIFKWSTDFRCSAESPIVPVWVSLPYLPVHFIHCKSALYSITAAIGTPLRVDHATASVNRPSVARVLVEYDVSQALLPRIWIGEGDSGFWQDVVFEKVPAYCSACKHLGHLVEACYVTNPGLRKVQQPKALAQRSIPDKGKEPIVPAYVQPTQAPAPQYVVVSDHRPAEPIVSEVPRPNSGGTDDILGQTGLEDGPLADMHQDTGIQGAADDIGGGVRPCRDTQPDDSSSGAKEDMLGRVRPSEEVMEVGFNTHHTEIPDSDVDDRVACRGITRSDADHNPEETGVVDDGYFMTDPEESHTPLPPDGGTFFDQQTVSSPRGFVVGRKNRKSRRRNRGSRCLDYYGDY